MNTPINRLSMAMERTGQWVFSQDVPTDLLVEVGEANFSLHKFMLVAKSNYIRNLIVGSKDADVTRINLSNVPGGPEIFEKAAKFCYGVNFEITVHNVAALRCAAEYLQMTNNYCENNLAGRTDDFLKQVALTSLSAAVIVLKSCEFLVPMAENIGLVQRCIDVVSLKACNEANFPCRSPANWWTEELTILEIDYFGRIITAMKKRGAKTPILATTLITYTERVLRDLIRDHSGNGTKSSVHEESELSIRQTEILESIVSLLPPEKTALPTNFLCCLLRCAIYLKASNSCKSELERRISSILDHVSMDDLLVLSLTYDGESLFDLESVRRIISSFVEKEKSMPVFNGGDYREVASPAMLRVARTVDAYLAEIAPYGELTISKFNGIANLIPKIARKVDDDLYRAVDLFLKGHPNLDEIEREKVCSGMDPLKLSYEARVHASQNKRLPVQVVLHALYYDQLKLRSGGVDNNTHVPEAVETRNQLQADVSLIKENEVLRTELMKMKLYVSEIQKNKKQTGHGGGSSSSSGVVKSEGTKKGRGFFTSMSRTLGKLNPFKNGSKDTLNIDDTVGVDVTKPRRRRFSIS